MHASTAYLLYGIVGEAAALSLAGDVVCADFPAKDTALGADSRAGSFPHEDSIEVIRYRGIAAVAKKIADPAVTAMTRDPGESRGEISAKLRDALHDYHQTNNAIFQRHTLLPLRFGMVAQGKEEVSRFLASGYLLLKSRLNALTGMSEFVVQLRWDFQAVLRELWQQRQATSPDGDWSTDARRLEAGQWLFQKTEARKRAICGALHAHLEPVCTQRVELPASEETMIVNTSCLIDRCQEPRLYEAAAAFAGRSAEYLQLKYMGPMPPYSFVPMAFSKGNFALIDEARRALGLPAQATHGQIRAAYRRLAQLYHPDKNAGDHGTFQTLKEAYDTLVAYCQSCGGGEDMGFSFVKEDVQRVFVPQ